MITTNALLTFALAVIGNFTNTVDVPPQSAPKDATDVRHFVIGAPGRPIDVFLTDQRGDSFEVRAGAVTAFKSRFCASSLAQGRAQGGEIGTGTLTTNEAFQIALRTLRRLTKGGGDLTNCRVTIRALTLSDKGAARLLEVAWINPPTYFGPATAASIEIDGRSGKILSLQLRATNFYDFTLEQQTKRAVYTQQSDPRPPPPRQLPLPHPDTNSVGMAIVSWLRFCNKLGLDPGTDTNIHAVNWGMTVLCTNDVISPTSAVCVVEFHNKTSFCSLNGVAYNHFCGDACYVGLYMQRPRDGWQVFRGRVVYRWEDLATRLETTMGNLLALAGARLPESKRIVRLVAADPGTEGMTRTVIEWRKWHPVDQPTSASAFPLLMDAEFDLESGKTKFIDLHDREIVDAIGRSLRGAREAQSPEPK